MKPGFGGERVTPLEKALEKQKNCCNDTTVINGVMYCNKSGKIILPMFTKNGENKECGMKNCRNRKEV